MQNKSIIKFKDLFMVVHDDKTNKIPHFSEQNIFQINSSKVKKNKKNFESNENFFEFQERRT